MNRYWFSHNLVCISKVYTYDRKFLKIVLGCKKKKNGVMEIYC